MKEIIIKAKLYYFIKWFSHMRCKLPIPYSADGRWFSLEYKYIEPINSPLLQQSGPLIELEGHYIDPEDDHGEHEEADRSIGYIEIIELDDDRLQLVIEQEEPEFENVINWVVNEIERIYPIESQTVDNSEDFIPHIPGQNESEIERTYPIESQTVDNSDRNNVPKRPVDRIKWERVWELYNERGNKRLSYKLFGEWLSKTHPDLPNSRETLGKIIKNGKEGRLNKI